MSKATTEARRLRANMTDAEVRLWAGLKKLRPEGFHFRRQAPFRGYYLDFVCYDRKLVIELDGAHHEEQEQKLHDTTRDRVLRQEGFWVLRFENKTLDRNMSEVMGTILQSLNRPLAPP